MQSRHFRYEESGLGDRDLLVMRVLEDGTGAAAGEPVPVEASASARREYGVEDCRFAVVLAGKDGIKFHVDEPAPASGIFGRIHAMPMRRESCERVGSG